LRNFPSYKKVDNAHSKLLAYPTFVYIQTMQNGKVHFAQFLWNKKLAKTLTKD